MPVRWLLAAAALAGGALACRQPPRAPTLATALANPAPARDLRVIGVPPWARLDGVWGVFPITHGSVEMAAFADDNRLVTLNENDGSLRVWDIRARAAIAAFDMCPPPPDLPAQMFIDYNRYTLAVSPDGQLAAVAHGKGTVCVRRLHNGTIEGNFYVGTTGLRTVSFWGSARLVGYHQHTPFGPTSALPPCVPNCPEPPPDGFISVWDVRTGKRVAQLHVGDLPGDEFGRPALTESLDGGRLVVPKGSEISLLNLATMKPIWSSRLAAPTWRTWLSSGDRVVVAAGRTDGTKDLQLSQFALADGHQVKSADVPPFDLVAADPRGRAAVVREANARDQPFHQVQLWDVPEMKLRKVASQYARPNGCSDAPMPQGKGVFSPDGSVLATWHGGITFWDVASLTPIVDGTGHCGGIVALALSPDGSRALSVGSDETVREWRVSDGVELRRWRRHTSSATYSPDGTKILFGGDAVVPVLDAATGDSIWKVDGRSWVEPVAFSPDGTLVATVGTREDLTVHDARTGRALWSHGPGRSMPTHQLVFTPDSRFIVANDDTYKLAVWDARTGRFVRSLGRSAQTIAMRRDGALVFQDQHRVVTLPVDGRPAAVQDEVSLGSPAFVLAADELSAFVREGGGVTLRRLDGGGDLGRIDLKAYSDTAGALALSRDGTRLLVGTGSGVILNVRLGATGRN